MSSTKATRRSYTREFKLAIVTDYRQSGSNLYRACKKHELNSKTVLRWIACEDQISKSSKGSKKVAFTRMPHHPEMEAALMDEFKSLRQKGIKVRGFWFKIRARQLLAAMTPDPTFQFSKGWFEGFKGRHGLSLRRATNTAQQPACDKLSLIRGFQQTIRRVAKPTDGAPPLTLAGLHSIRLPTWIRLLYHSPLPAERRTSRLGLSLYGFVVVRLAWRRGNVRFS